MNKVILLYGLPASGKLTIASRLADEDNSFLIDSHYVHNFLRPFIGDYAGERNYWDNEEYWQHVGNVRSELLKVIGSFHPKDGAVSYIFTQVVLDKDVEMEMERFIRLAEDIGGEFYPIWLCPGLETLKQRCVTEDRRNRKKISTIERLTNFIDDRQCSKKETYKHPNHLILDTSDMTEEETYQAVRKHIANK